MRLPPMQNSASSRLRWFLLHKEVDLLAHPNSSSLAQVVIKNRLPLRFHARVAITYLEQCASHMHRHIQRGAGDQFIVVHVPAMISGAGAVLMRP